MSNSTIALVVMSGVIGVFIFYMIATLYPSATGTIANSTLANNAVACKNCDSGVKLLGQQLPFMILAVTLIAIVTIAIIVISRR